MAVNESRNMNQDLKEGVTDGWVKKTAPNRGGDRTDFSESAKMMSNLSHDLYDVALGQANALADRIVR